MIYRLTITFEKFVNTSGIIVNYIMQNENIIKKLNSPHQRVINIFIAENTCTYIKFRYDSDINIIINMLESNDSTIVRMGLDIIKHYKL
jgi:hypothetical protein